jgi:hypothetical protein
MAQSSTHKLKIIVSPIRAGTVTVGSKKCTSTCSYTEKAGAKVKLSEKATSSKKPFKHWVVGGKMGKSAATTTVTMSKSTVTVKAVYK